MGAGQIHGGESVGEKREKMRRKEHMNTNVHQYTPAKKHPSAQVVPGGAGGDPCGEEGEKVVDGV